MKRSKIRRTVFHGREVLVKCQQSGSRTSKSTLFPVGALLVLLGTVFCGICVGAEGTAYLADRHKAAGLTCEECHGSGPKQAVGGEKCLSCHESYQKVAQRTARLRPNPHDNHLIDLECTKCHQGHKAQENYCNSCHSDLVFEERPEKK